MAKETVTAAAVEPIKTANTGSFDLSLDEFCRRLSLKVGPEMVGGFYQAQKAAKKTKSSQAAFMRAFDLFTKQPA